ncbi:hypothetical protein ACKKBG_A13205 [Auxenochlorella protothecoides x Auxenochlorella symbiontica]
MSLTVPFAACSPRAAPSLRSTFREGAALQVRTAPPRTRPAARTGLKIYQFGFLKKLGLEKPEFLPDFGAPKRKLLLEGFFSSINQDVLANTLSDDFKFSDRDRVYTKDEFAQVLKSVKAAIPDFQWHASTDGLADKKDKKARVEVRITGTHTGAPLAFPGLKEVPSSGKKVDLPSAKYLVSVEEGRITSIEADRESGSSLLSLYAAVGGVAQVAS